MSQSNDALKAAAIGQPLSTDVKSGPPRDLPAMLTAWKGEIQNALPKHLNADRMARIALTCFRNTPKLNECDPRSVFGAVLQAAQLGLEPGLLGEAHLIPYGKMCQLIPGYQGLIKLAKQTGQVVDIYAMVVREKDKFSCAFGLNRDIKHEPKYSRGGFPASIVERGEVIGVYAVAVFKDGTRTFVVMGRDEIDLIRDNSQGYKSAKKYGKDSPWTTHYEEMANKTAIRRLCKTLPKSPELAAAIALEDAHNRGMAHNIDMGEALSGNYTPPPGDGDVIDVDQDTGEVLSKQPEPKDTDAAQQSKPKTTTPLFTMRDVLKLVNKGDYAAARDLLKEPGFTENDRLECESAVRRHEKGERVG